MSSHRTCISLYIRDSVLSFHVCQFHYLHIIFINTTTLCRFSLIDTIFSFDIGVCWCYISGSKGSNCVPLPLPLPLPLRRLCCVFQFQSPSLLTVNVVSHILVYHRLSCSCSLLKICLIRMAFLPLSSSNSHTLLITLSNLSSNV